MNPHALKRLRTHANLSQHELARRAGTSTSTINRIETGERTLVRSDTLAAIAEALATALGDRDRGSVMAELTTDRVAA